MRIQFRGAAKTVTGSCYSLTVGDEKILIDCGMFQGSKDIEKFNHENFDFDPKEYKALILTHAHLDHCGRIPKLVKKGFRGKIYSTDATKELSEIIMLDAAHIAKMDTEDENKRRKKENLPLRKPIYDESDVKMAMRLFNTVEYKKEVTISKNIRAKYYNAGHILGASSVQLITNDSGKEKVISFSGDIGQKESIIIRSADPIKKSDYVVIESTYGDRLHPPIPLREKELIRVINETYEKGGKLLIPSFAVERAQDILYYIGQFMEKGIIPKIEVYLDSPMAMKATEVFSRHKEYYNDSVLNAVQRKKNVFNFVGLTYTLTRNESKELNYLDRPCIIIAGNGMCTAGRIKHHIRNGINDPKNTLLLIGYQAEGTLGYWLQKGEKKINLLGVELDVKAKIESIEGFSGHGDYNELIAWINNFSPIPKKVIITHGEEAQMKEFSKKLTKLGYKTHIPSMNEEIVL